MVELAVERLELGKVEVRDGVGVAAAVDAVGVVREEGLLRRALWGALRGTRAGKEGWRNVTPLIKLAQTERLRLGDGALVLALSVHPPEPDAAAGAAAHTHTTLDEAEEDRHERLTRLVEELGSLVGSPPLQSHTAETMLAVLQGSRAAQAHAEQLVHQLTPLGQSELRTGVRAPLQAGAGAASEVREAAAGRRAKAHMRRESRGRGGRLGPPGLPPPGHRKPPLENVLEQRAQASQASPAPAAQVEHLDVDPYSLGEELREGLPTTA